MRTIHWAALVAMVTLVGVVGANLPVSGAPTFGDDSKPEKAAAAYEEGMKAVKAGDFERALDRFKAADKLKKNDPDTLNMLAYTNRKLGRLDEAFELYAQALKRRPKFPEAREYLGEAHLQAALKQVEELKGYGDEGKEELAELVAAIKNAAKDLEGGSETTEVSW